VVFINAALMKLVDMNMVTGYFTSMGLSAPFAYLVSYAELIAGIALILGIFVRYAGLILFIIMAGATWLLSSNGFSLANGGFEYPFVLGLVSYALITMGAGKYSLKEMMKKK
jgi:putative oxidoreductase